MTDTAQQHYFITGGAGYIGSHTVLALLRGGHGVTIFDNFSNSSRDVIDRLSSLAGVRPELIEGDIRDETILSHALSAKHYSAVLHFAGLKSVSESVSEPELYHAVNVAGTKALLSAMRAGGCKSMVFSSSATVYGNNGVSPIREDTPVDPVNPYGQTKVDCEILLQQECADNSDFSAAILRYFNPVGADKSAKIGELPTGVPANLMPVILEAANGERETITIYGEDYDTPDGTGVRDFIHVSDLADGHIAALPHILSRKGAHVLNLGTGRGYSVREMIETFETVNNAKVPYQVGPRRPGDLGEVVADPGHARDVLGWEAKLSLEDMCRDAWAWKKQL